MKPKSTSEKENKSWFMTSMFNWLSMVTHLSYSG